MQMRTVRRWAGRGLLIALALLLLLAAFLWWQLRASLPQLDGTVAVSGLTASVTVQRDAQGVPLISGADRGDIAFATGYVHAQERFFQMDLLRRVGAGELAELFGEKAVSSDRRHRLHRFRARAERMLASLGAQDRALLDRYVSGVNAGLNALPARPFEYFVLGATPRPWQASDSLLVVCAMYFDLQGNLPARELARGWVRDHSDAAQLAFLLPEASRWDAALDGDYTGPVAPIPASAPAWWGKRAGDQPSQLASADFADSVGSNNWAIAGSRSASGRAIVADDMHLGLSLPNIWYRVALQFPDGAGGQRRIVGVTLPGALPTVVVGSNGRVAWGYTNSYGDYLDLVELERDPARPGQVRTPAGWETPVTHSETLRVKGMESITLQVRETSLGPIREAGAKAYAVRWLAHDAGALNLRPQLMESAASLDEALAIATTLGIPAQNFVGGDASGNIGWTIAGQLPLRTSAAASFPIGVNDTLATFSAAAAPAAHPRVINPAAGQLSTANSRQLLGQGAAIIGDGGFDIGARHRQVRDGLGALGAKVGIGGAASVALDDRALFIAPWRARALAVLDAEALRGKPARARFRELLHASWTGRASVDAAGYRLARQFMWSLHDRFYGHANTELERLDAKATMVLASSRWPAVLARLIDEQPRAWLPAGTADWRAVQLAAIDHAIGELTKDGAALSDATWGARNKASIAHPMAASLPLVGRWLSAPADPLAGDANMPRVAGPRHGQSQRMTVSPGDEENGIYNMPGGQSGHPLSPFFLSGHAEWVAGKPTPMLPGAPVHRLQFVRQ